MRGIFITLYGINNIGKSTQIRYLLERCKREGITACTIKYPVYDLEPTGPRLNRILRSHEDQKISEEELQALFKKNRQDFEPQLQKLLEQYQIVLAEDYTGTGIAWGMAKGLSQEWLEDLNQDLLQEDYGFLLKGKRSMEAREIQHIHEKNDALVEKVADILELLSHQKKWDVIDVQPTPDQTSEIVWGKIHYLLHHGKS